MSAPAEPCVQQDTNIPGDGNTVNIAGRDIIHILSLRFFRWGSGSLVIAAIIGVLIPLIISGPTSVQTSSPFHQSFATVTGAATTDHLATVAPDEQHQENAATKQQDRSDSPSPSVSAPKISQVSFDASPTRPLLPAPTEWPSGKSALCRNGEYSASHHRSGTCSGNHGVAFWRYPPDHPYWNRRGEA